MKKFFFPLILLITFFSCKKIDKLTQFHMEYNEEVTIPSTMGIGLPLDLFTPDVTTNSEYTFSENDTRKDLIEEIKLTDLVMTIKSPSGSDFSFLKAIEVYINADGLDETLIASATDIPETVGDRLELEVENIDLKEFVKKDEFKLRVKTTTDEAFSPDHKVNVYSRFFVDAKILGL